MTRYPLPTEIVPAKTLAQVLREHGLDHVDLLKVDIEGGEYEAILGSPELFERKMVGAIALELHPQCLERKGRSEQQIVSFLTKAEYVLSSEAKNAVWVVAKK
jgi:hypothetical protein